MVHGAAGRRSDIEAQRERQRQGTFKRGFGRRPGCLDAPRDGTGEGARPRSTHALWLGAWLVAGGGAVDAFPDDMDELAAQFFARLGPAAKA
jgi:hypothetical protein